MHICRITARIAKNMYVCTYLLPMLGLHIRQDAARQAVTLDYLTHVHVWAVGAGGGGYVTSNPNVNHRV